MKPTASDLLKCARRELAMRRVVYPRQRKPEAEAAHEIACMEAIVELCQANLERVGNEGDMFAEDN